MTLKTKLSIVLVVLVGICSFLLVNEGYLTLDVIQQNLKLMRQQYDASPIMFLFMFIVGYTLFVALYVPGPFILNLMAGAIFGPFIGTAAASVAAALGSVAAFLVARYILYDAVRGRFPGQVISIDKAIEEMGGFYVLLLRLVPGLPVGLTNLLMGVTNISALRFFMASLVGVVPWIAFYVVAGGKLAQMKSIDDIASVEMSLMALALAVLLIGGRLLSRKISDPRTPERRRGRFV
ncbi:TVP38/TMEM64 family protein [Kordiimonas aestuarii]|uniref:TVP38/TMEM64 family protein n=1 Tax=Kordiimonas aestuarii TaxID=1005925 RepID=UPI0021D2BD8C|nr:VTT domain-containing protein [Kordiimonas aestuarii]